MSRNGMGRAQKKQLPLLHSISRWAWVGSLMGSGAHICASCLGVFGSLAPLTRQPLFWGEKRLGQREHKGQGRGSETRDPDPRRFGL